MPSLGADMSEGTLLEWHMHPGDIVHRGDIVAVVDTEKSAIDIEVFEDGRVERLLIEEGTKVPVGTPLAVIEPVSDEAKAPARAPAPAPAPAPTPATKAAPGRRVSASPLARRRAQELGIDLESIRDVGSQGVVTVADIERAAQPKAPAEPSIVTPAKPSSATAASEADRAASMRSAIGALMARSKREIPHYYLESLIDLSGALERLAELNAQRPIAERILPAAVLLKCAALAAHEVPGMNGFYRDGVFEQQEHVHLGVAVSLRGGGLIAPALHDAAELPLADLMARMKDLVTRARSGRLRASEMSDSTITVTNLGDQGAELVHGVIYPPQVALVGFGRIVERPWATGGLLGVRPTVTVTLAADHRVSDGHRGGLLLAAIEEHLQRPEEL
jgi:pyruvate dehydrogenase E2 component (dihydrolipoamide acetyltransferase)